MNEAITAPEVRVVGPEREPLGIMPIEEARERAQELEVDVVMVTADADPPVVRLVEWSKLKFEKEKAQKMAKAKQRESAQDTKELKMRPSTDVHDYEVRLKRARKFIEKNDKVKVIVQVRAPSPRPRRPPPRPPEEVPMTKRKSTALKGIPRFRALL